MADIERFWCPRDVQFYLDNDGFLADPDNLILGRISPNPQAIPTSELQNTRGLVLLGEMGAGKSTIFERPDQLIPPGMPRRVINIAPYGSEDRFVNEVVRDPSIEQWRAGFT